MIKNKEKGFTMVELLQVMDTLNTRKKRTLELTTRSIIKAAEEKYLENISYGINEEITCESVSNITSNDFQSCKIVFDEVGNATVTLIRKGRYDGLNACNATKTNAIDKMIVVKKKLQQQVI